MSFYGTGFSENLNDLLQKLNPLFKSQDLNSAISLAKAYTPSVDEEDDFKNILIKLHQTRGEQRFKKADIQGSVDDFEFVVKKNPGQKAFHWQLGISYYYNKQYQEGKGLFQLHKTVNPNDVENAVWHFICNTQIVGFEKAQAALIPIKHDSRVPMMDIYELFAGRLSLDKFFEKIPNYKKVDSPRTTSLMYTHQYLGLYFEALNKLEKAKEHTLLAAEHYHSYQRSHYMGDTVVTHLIVNKWK